MRRLLICVLVPAAFALAQENPISAFQQRAHGQLKSWLTRAAEKMPEENYTYRPTDSVRSFGQLVGHVADSQYYFCSAAMGEKNPGLKIEQTKTSKADLLAALQESMAYCDKAYNGMTDATATQTVKAMGGDMTRLSLLTTNIAHNAEHYGNITTYLRMKNVVPPSTEDATRPPAKK